MKKRGVRPNGYPAELCCCNGTGILKARDLCLLEYGCCQIASSPDLLQQTSSGFTAALSSIRGGPTGHGLGCGKE